MIEFVRWLFGFDKDEPYGQDNPDYRPREYRSFYMLTEPQHEAPMFVPREQTNLDGRVHGLRHSETLWNDTVANWYVYNSAADWFVKYSQWHREPILDQQPVLDENVPDNNFDDWNIPYFGQEARNYEPGIIDQVDNGYDFGQIRRLDASQIFTDASQIFTSDLVSCVSPIRLTDVDPDIVEVYVDGYKYELIRDDCENED